MDEITFLKPDIILPSIKKRFNTIDKNFDISDNTIKNMSSAMRVVHRFYAKSELPENHDIFKAIRNLPYSNKNINTTFKFLKDEKFVLDMIVRFISRFSTVYCVLLHIRGFTSTVKIIYPYLKSKCLQYDKLRLTDTIDDTIIDNLSFDKDVILQKISDNPHLTNYQILNVMLLLLIPTRRMGDYLITKIHHSIPDTNINKKFNYYFDKHIYIYNTKNQEYFDLHLPDEIIPYIDITKEFLLYDKRSYFTAFISKTFQLIYNYPYNPRIIRHLYATYNNTNCSKKERFQNATAMGHSIVENLKYSYK